MDWQPNFQYRFNMTHAHDRKRPPTERLATSEGETDRPFPVRPIWVPDGIRLDSAEDLIALPPSAGRRSERPAFPKKGMFEEFVNLKEASSAAILEYARRWGMLGIWQDSHPAVEAIIGESADPADPFPQPLPRTADVTRYGFFGWIGGEYVEPAAIWRLFACQAHAVLDVAALLHAGELAPKDEMALVHAFCHPIERPKLARDAVRQWDLIGAVIEDWLILGRVMPSLTRFAGNVGVSYAGTRLFGYLAVQLLLAVARAEGFVTCSGCTRIYEPQGRRPAPGKRRFCRKCRNAGMDVKAAQSDYRRRLRAKNSKRSRRPAAKRPKS